MPGIPIPAMFEVVTPENSATITLNDNSGRGNASARWVIANNPKAVWWAIKCYASQCGIELEHVGYSVVSGKTYRSHQIIQGGRALSPSSKEGV
jgi:hypothetical protein